MTENEEIRVRKRRSSQEIRRLVTEFEASGLRQVEFCKQHRLALSTLQRGLKRRRTFWNRVARFALLDIPAGFVTPNSLFKFEADAPSEI